MNARREERLQERQKRKEDLAIIKELKRKEAWKLRCKLSVRKEQKVREKKKLAAQERRRKIQADPVKYAAMKAKERQRWKDRVAQGKVKTVKDMTDREKRKVRRLRKKSVKKYRAKKREEQDIAKKGESQEKVLVTPTTQQQVAKQVKNTKAQAGRKKMKAGRSKCYRTIDMLQKENEILRRKYWRLEKAKQRQYKKEERQNAINLSPRKAVNRLTEGKFIGDRVKRKLVFGEVLINRLVSVNQTKDQRVKKIINSTLSSKYLRKYRMMHEAYSVMSRRLMRMKEHNKDESDESDLQNLDRAPWVSAVKRRQQTVDYLLRDSVSMVSPNKKDYIKKNGVKKRKRYLSGTLKDLYEGFRSDPNHVKVSYALFCRLKPFWVVEPKMSERQTCLCTHCENMKLLIKALHSGKVLNAKTPSEFIASMCCDYSLNEQCLQRSCEKCKDKTIIFNECDPADVLKRSKWVRVTQVKGELSVKRNVKQDFQETILALQKELESIMKMYFMHRFRATHQSKTIKAIIQRLAPGELLVHVDFSENYSCKYNREIQSAYYGASKESVVIHQGMAYTVGEKQAFCTLSSCMKKDPAAITAHVSTFLQWYFTQHPEITTVHVCSDSPTSQYRNKENFYAMTRIIPKIFPQITSLSYHFTEAGHGKSTADGVGAWAKCAADQAVKYGEDIPDLNTLVEVLKKKSTKTHIEVVTADDVQNIRLKMPSDLNTFHGTTTVHHFTWTKEREDQIYFSSVSCTCCAPGTVCSHYGLPGCPWNAYGQQSSTPACRNELPDFFHVGDWVAVAYNAHWYPGIVEKVIAKSVHVNFMVRHEKSEELFLWPQKTDVQTVKKNNILYKFQSPPVAKSRVFFCLPEIAIVNGIMEERLTD